MSTARDLAGTVGVHPACRALGLAAASYYRWRSPLVGPPKPRPRPPLALSDTEEQTVLDVLHSSDYVDQAPAEVYAALLDQGTHHCSTRTMYRVLERRIYGLGYV